MIFNSEELRVQQGRKLLFLLFLMEMKARCISFKPFTFLETALIALLAFIFFDSFIFVG